MNKSNDTVKKEENGERHLGKKSKTGAENTLKTTQFSKAENTLKTAEKMQLNYSGRLLLIGAEAVVPVLPPAFLYLPCGFLPLLIVRVADEPLVEDFELEQELRRRHALATLPFRELRRGYPEQPGSADARQASELPVPYEPVRWYLLCHAFKVSKNKRYGEDGKNINRLIFWG
jgi:hypothetical protein